MLEQFLSIRTHGENPVKHVLALFDLSARLTVSLYWFWISWSALCTISHNMASKWDLMATQRWTSKYLDYKFMIILWFWLTFLRIALGFIKILLIFSIDLTLIDFHTFRLRLPKQTAFIVR